MKMMYLVRHAEAKSKGDDPQRPLTAKGRRSARDVAALLKRLGVEVWQIRHSGKTRARQTAEILGKALYPAGGAAEARGLSPTDDVAPIAEELENADVSLMLVGHLPFLERLAGHLLAGDAESTAIAFAAGSVAGLAYDDDGDWHLHWLITPEIAIPEA